MPAPETTPTRPAPDEEGSAYIVTLMVLFILTVIGMSLTLVTQTEMLVGSQDRITQRVFYAADAGLQVAIARALNFNIFGVDYELQQSAQIMPGRTLTMADRVQVSPFVPLWRAECLGCPYNQDTAQDYKRINFIVTSLATRVGKDTVGVDDVPVARKQLNTMVSFVPWDASLVQWTWEGPGDEEILKRVVF